MEKTQNVRRADGQEKRCQHCQKLSSRREGRAKAAAPYSVSQARRGPPRARKEEEEAAAAVGGDTDTDGVFL